jgi:hypothetical protein
MFKKKPLIQFVSNVPGLESIPDCMPKPAKYYIPEWFKSIPSSAGATVKVCPSFPDFFSQGYVVPMWSDVNLYYDKAADVWQYRTPLTEITWEMHDNFQFMDHVEPYMNGEEGEFIFKTNCPWRLITPPGYSVLQLPLFYHFNKEYSILPGVVDTDIHHGINQQVLYHGKGKEISIKRGDPFVLYIPFKRTKYDLSVKKMTEYYSHKFSTAMLSIVTTFPGNGSYRKMQRERDARLAK